MGWDVWLTVNFQKPEDPVQRFSQVAAKFALSERHHELLRLRVRSGVYRNDILEDQFIGGNRETPISYEQIQQLPQRYKGDEIATEGWWEVSPRYLMDLATRTPQLDNYRVIVTTLGSKYKYPGLHSPIDLIYNPGDYKHFLPSVMGKAAKLNIEALIQEIPLFVELGVETIRGLDADRSTNPCQSYLCYHHNPDSFFLDLKAIYKNEIALGSLGKEEILNAALICSDVSFLETENGLIVYHKELVGGCLKNFYQELFNLSSHG